MADEPTTRTPAADCWGNTAQASPGATQLSAAAGGSGKAELVAKLGTVLSAIMASSCCWLPPLLILAGVSGAGMTRALEQYRPLFIVVTFGFLGLAFFLTYRKKPAPAQPGRRLPSMMALNKVMLWAVTAMAVVFLFFPQIVMGLFAASGELTPDMQKTVVQVVGMTCPGWELKAETAIKTAPGVLAVQANYESGEAVVGTEPGTQVPLDEIQAALKSIGYEGRVATEGAEPRAAVQGTLDGTVGAAESWPLTAK